MIALDTNILIYCCDSRDTRRQQIALDLVAGTTEGILPWQVACEFIAASRKLAEQGDDCCTFNVCFAVDIFCTINGV